MIRRPDDDGTDQVSVWVDTDRPGLVSVMIRMNGAEAVAELSPAEAHGLALGLMGAAIDVAERVTRS